MMELQRQGSASESAKLLAVWRSVNSIRQDFNTTNNSTAKDLDRMRSDLSEWSCKFEIYFGFPDRSTFPNLAICSIIFITQKKILIFIVIGFRMMENI